MRSILFFLATFSVGVRSQLCLHPPAAPNFTDELYSGTWYEIGKIQTPGGAEYQDGTICATVTYSPYYDPVNGGGDIGYSSKVETTGRWSNATGYLTEEDFPGHFTQVLTFFGKEGPAVDYNVIWIDEEAALEYDCLPNDDGTVDYCVHFISRKPIMDLDKFIELYSFVESLGLDNQAIGYKQGDQSCYID